MKSRGDTRRHYRGRRRGARRQAAPTTAAPTTAAPTPTTRPAQPSIRQAVSRQAAPPPPPAPVGGIPHRQVLHDIKTISIIGGAILVLLFGLFLAWR